MVNKQVPYIIKIKQEFSTTLNTAHSVKISLFFTMIL